jgi:hypothetical protein
MPHAKNEASTQAARVVLSISALTTHSSFRQRFGQTVYQEVHGTMVIIGKTHRSLLEYHLIVAFTLILKTAGSTLKTLAQSCAQEIASIQFLSTHFGLETQFFGH